MDDRLTVVNSPVDICIGGHAHESKVGEVDLRKRHDKGVVFVLLTGIHNKDSKVMRIFMRKGIVGLVH